MTNKTTDWSNVGNWIQFDGYTFNNLSEAFRVYPRAFKCTL
jgi:hypothetical protein